MLRDLKNKLQDNRKSRILFSIAILLTGLLLMNVSLAYFTNNDNATNRLSSDISHGLEIKLIEPNWTEEGEEQAQKIVPGMEIPKDPTVQNTLPTDVYLRLQIEIRDKDNKLIEPTDLKDKGLNDYNTDDPTTIKDTYTKVISTILYNDNQLLSVKDGNVESTNPNYYYDAVGNWFYYVEDRKLLKLEGYKGGTPPKTAPLFTSIKLPVFKSEYEDFFAKGYKIIVRVQAVDVKTFGEKNSINEDFESIEEVFKCNFPQT